MEVKVNAENILSVLKKSGKSVLDQRASEVYSDLKMAEDNYLKSKQDEVAKINSAIKKHMDLSVRNTISLDVAENSGYSPDEWVERLNELFVDLRNAQVELEVAQGVRNSVFATDADAQTVLLTVN